MKRSRKQFDWDAIRQSLAASQLNTANDLATRSAAQEAVFHRRAIRLAAREKLTKRAAAMQALIVAVGQERYGIDVAKLSEIVPLANWTKVPGGPPELLGVMNLHGDLHSLIDLSQVLNGSVRSDPPAGYGVFVRNGSDLVGLLVDQIDRVASIELTAIAAIGDLESAAADMVCGVSPGNILLLDVDKLLARAGCVRGESHAHHAIQPSGARPKLIHPTKRKLDMTIGKKISTGFGFALAVLIVVGATAYYCVTGLIANNRAVVHSDMVIGELEQLLSSVRDAETGQRGFVLTGQPEYLEPYNGASDRIDRALKEARQLTADNPAHQHRLDKIEPLIAAKLKELAQTIDERNVKGFEVALATVKEGRGKAMMDQTRKIINEMQAEERELLNSRTNEAESGAGRTLTAITIGTLLAIVLVQASAFLITRSIVRPLRCVVEATRCIAAGDLRPKQMPRTSDYEIRQLSGAYDQMVGGLKTLAGQVRSVTENVNSAATQISASTRQQAASVKEQAATIQEITSTMQELGQAGEQIVDRARELTTMAEAATSASGSGIQAVQQTSCTMEAIREQIEEVAENIVALSEKTQAISEIISTVNDVAEQSNLLALNATIEAVAAGSHGSRFSVVASEMKNLADQAKQCTVQVRTILGDIQKGINSSVMLTEEAVKRAESGKQQADISQETIHRMTETTVASVQAFQQIIGATSQQQIGFEQVTRGMQDIRQATQETASGTAQLEQAVLSLTTLSHQLRNAVGSYQL